MERNLLHDVVIGVSLAETEVNTATVSTSLYYANRSRWQGVHRRSTCIVVGRQLRCRAASQRFTGSRFARMIRYVLVQPWRKYEILCCTNWWTVVWKFGLKADIQFYGSHHWFRIEPIGRINAMGYSLVDERNYHGDVIATQFSILAIRPATGSSFEWDDCHQCQWLEVLWLLTNAGSWWPMLCRAGSYKSIHTRQSCA